jgi:hypothetical protein
MILLTFHVNQIASFSELISLYGHISSKYHKERKENNFRNGNNKSNSKLHLHLLNSWDLNQILKFMKAFHKKGRSLFEENLPFNGKVSIEEKINLQEHLQVLNDLEKARKSGDRYNRWRLIRLISVHYNPFIKSLTRIPNIKGFRIELYPHHPILKLFGILLRMESANLEFNLLDKNDKLNKYNEYMFKKLHDLRSEPKAFWFYASN